MSINNFHWWARAPGASGDGAIGSWSIDVEMEPSSDYVLASAAMSSFNFTAADYGALSAGIASIRKRDPNTGIDSNVDFSDKPGGILPIFSDTNVSDVTFLFAVESGGDYSNIWGWLSFQILWISF